MSPQPQPPLPLRKPPGYRDPATSNHQYPPPGRKAVKLPPSFQQSSKRRKSCCRIFCCCLCLSLFILIIVFSLAGFLFYLWYQPRLPQVHLKGITFTKLNVTNGPALDAQSTVDVVLRNPNQNFGIVYGRSHIQLSAFNGEVNLGEQTLGGFNQDRNNVTTLRFGTKVHKETIVDGKSAEELKKGIKNKDLMVNAEIRSGIGFRQGGWSIKPLQVNVMCDGMRLNHLQRAAPKCRIKLLDWVYIN